MGWERKGWGNGVHSRPSGPGSRAWTGGAGRRKSTGNSRQYGSSDRMNGAMQIRADRNGPAAADHSASGFAGLIESVRLFSGARP